MLNYILEFFWIQFILFIWFHTDAFIQYCKLFRITKPTGVDSYLEYKKSNPKITFPDFIRRRQTFFTQLISCPPCILAWIILICSLFFQNTHLFPIYYITSLSFYMILRKKLY